MKIKSIRPGCLVINQTSCTHFALSPSQLSQQGMGTEAEAEGFQSRCTGCFLWQESAHLRS